MWWRTKKIKTKEDAIQAIINLSIFAFNREQKIEIILDSLISNELAKQKEYYINLIKNADEC